MKTIKCIFGSKEHIENIIDLCIEKYTKVDIKSALSADKEFIVDLGERYNELAKEGQLKLLDVGSTCTSILTGKQLKSIFDYKFKSGIVRDTYYDKILSNVDTCPICGCTDPDTIDHFLPKSIFPSLSFVPYNLVPMCTKCNSSKGVTYAKGGETSLLHAFYDYVDDLEWLNVEYSLNDGKLIISFDVHESIRQLNVYDILVRHLSIYKLKSRYSRKVRGEIAENKLLWKNKYENGGSHKLELHIENVLQSIEVVNRNSWKTAMYRGILSNQNIDVIIEYISD